MHHDEDANFCVSTKKKTPAKRRGVVWRQWRGLTLLHFGRSITKAAKNYFCRLSYFSMFPGPLVYAETFGFISGVGYGKRAVFGNLKAIFHILCGGASKKSFVPLAANPTKPSSITQTFKNYPR